MIKASYPTKAMRYLAVLLLSAVAAAVAISLLPQAGSATEEPGSDPLLPIASGAKDEPVSKSDIESEVVVVLEEHGREVAPTTERRAER